MDYKLILDLAVVEESRSDAEALANILRNGGLKTRLTFVEDKEDLDELLASRTPDLILHASDDNLSLQAVCGAVARKEKNTPVIAVAETCDEVAIINAMRDGASDLCSYDQPDHLQLVARREVGRVLFARKVQGLKNQLEETERRAHLLMESSRDAISYVHEGTHVFANKSYLELFGFESMDEIQGTPIMDMVVPEDREQLKEFLRHYEMEGNANKEFSARGLLKDGTQFEALMEFTPASVSGEPCTQIIIRNTSADAKELEMQIQNLARQDMVTGLYNRQHFLKELESTTRDIKGNAQTGALMYLLVDNFKDIKDNVGIGMADKIISDIANILKSHCAPEDIVARFGDHSYTVLRPASDEGSTRDLGESLRQAIEEHVADFDDVSVTTTCSIGMTLIDEATSSAQDVLTRADLACEVARSAGGNQIHLHSPVVDEKLGKERDQHIRTLIREALDQDLFRLMFQPVVSLQGDTRENYEVLLRMIDSASEMILPAQFLAVAADTGQIAEIDRWVISHAIQTLSEHRCKNHNARFFLKLSTQTLLDERTAKFIVICLREAKLPGEALIFQVPEQAASQHLNQAKAFILYMRKFRVRTALEHFGGTPNSFQLLKHLPVDYLKIDGTFIHNLASSNENQEAVGHIIETARQMNIKCIAEFVEDPHSLAVLWQNGIDYIQGNFLQEPSESLEYDFASEIA